MNWSGEWWIGVLGGALALLIGTVLYARRTRKSAFRSVAAHIGLSAFDCPNTFRKEERRALTLFSRGYGGKQTNMVADRPDPPSMLLFDFGYKFGLPIIAHVRYNQTVAAFSARLTDIPDFQMTPVTVLDRAAPKLGLQAIGFDSHPDFATRYWLRAKDETAVRAFFSSSFLDRLKASDPAANWSVEKAGRWLIIYCHNALLPSKAIPEFWRTAHGMARVFLDPH